MHFEDVFTYSGALSEGVIASTGASLRNRLDRLNVPRDVARKIFSSYIELAYNVIHHGESDTSPPGTLRVHRGEIRVQHDGDAYHMHAESSVSADHVASLADRLEMLRSMSNEQIRFEFRLRLTNLQFAPEADTGRNAGLGLVTIARNASKPIEYTVRANPANPLTRLFHIHAVI